MNHALETWVRRLTPPANREEVLGDLAERCAMHTESRPSRATAGPWPWTSPASRWSCCSRRRCCAGSRRRIVRRAMRIEFAACVLTGVMFAAFALFLHLPLIGKLGAWWRVAVTVAIVGAVAFVLRLVPYATIKQARRRLEQLSQVSEMPAPDSCA